jgi:hypothetical protein
MFWQRLALDHKPPTYVFHGAGVTDVTTISGLFVKKGSR